MPEALQPADVASVPRAGWIGQWRQASFAIRTLGHVGAALSSPGRSRLQRAGLLGLSLVGDVLVSREAGTWGRSARRESLLNGLDVAAWSAIADGAHPAIRPALIATVVPTSIESGFRLGAGTEAVPLVQPATRWEPAWAPPFPRVLSLPWSRARTPEGRAAIVSAFRSPSVPRPRLARWAALTGAVAADVGIPVVVGASVRRRRGCPMGLAPVGWSAFAAVGGYALARLRDDAQRSTRAAWEDRTAQLVDEHRLTSHMQGALLHNLAAIDPKSLLLALAREGSTAADACLQELRAAPVEALARTARDGTTLSNAAEQRTIVPAEDGYRWVPNAQVRALRAAIEVIDDELEAAPVGGSVRDDDTILVRSTSGPNLVVEYRGRPIELARPVPDLPVRMDPAVGTLVLGMAWTAISTFPSLGRAPLRGVVPALGLQGLAVYRLASKTARERRSDRTTLLLVMAGVVGVDAAIGLSQTRTVDARGGALCPGTGATAPLSLLLASSWADLGPERWWAAGVGAAAWAFALRAPGGRSLAVLVNELAFVLMPAAAASTMGDDARREAEALDAQLDRLLAERVAADAREAAREEIAHFAQALQTVLDELERFDLNFDPDTMEEVRAVYATELERLATTDPLDVINW